MLIDVKCVCGQRFKLEEEKAGERVPCSACWRTVTIPVKNVLETPPESAVAALPAAAESQPADIPTVRPAEQPVPSGPKIVVKCLCGTVNEAPPELAGQQVQCGGCWRTVLYPIPEVLPADAPPSPRRIQTILVYCRCGKKLRVPGNMIGLEVQCPLCTRMVTVPDPEALPPVEAAPPQPPPQRTSVRDYLYWALLPALVPLVLWLFAPPAPSMKKRVEQALQDHPEVRQQLFQHYARRLPLDPSLDDLLLIMPLDDLLKALPNARLDDDAYLPRTTHMHWLYAGACAIGFFILALLLFVRSVDQARAILLVGLFSGTLGVCLLLGVESIVGLSLLDQLLLDPDADLIPSLFAFIFGVGLFEELFKALPLLWYFRFRGTLSWREACLWGMASGAGFGISEGINYSSLLYNGITGSDLYVIRFVSCVTLHAVWTASVGVTLARSRTRIQGGIDTVLEGTMPVWAWVVPLLRVLAVAMTLHGLYDVCVSRETLHVWAPLVALLSFAWLGWQIECCREEDQQTLAATKEAKLVPSALA